MHRNISHNSARIHRITVAPKPEMPARACREMRRNTEDEEEVDTNH